MQGLTLVKAVVEAVRVAGARVEEGRADVDVAAWASRARAFQRVAEGVQTVDESNQDNLCAQLAHHAVHIRRWKVHERETRECGAKGQRETGDMEDQRRLRP